MVRRFLNLSSISHVALLCLLGNAAVAAEAYL